MWKKPGSGVSPVFRYAERSPADHRFNVPQTGGRMRSGLCGDACLPIFHLINDVVPAATASLLGNGPHDPESQTLGRVGSRVLLVKAAFPSWRATMIPSGRRTGKAKEERVRR